MQPGRLLAATASICLLASCGGGDGGSTPTPTPTPSPTPAPTPTPTPSYPTFASLTGDQQYANACASISGLDGIDMPTPDGISRFEPAGSLRYESASQTYSLFPPNVSRAYRFAPADSVSSDAGAIRFRNAQSDQETAEFSIENPGALLIYSRRSDLDVTLKFEGKDRDQRRTFCILGVPTRPDDRPAQPIVDFTSFGFDGVIYDRRSGTVKVYDVDGGSATLRADLTTGTVSSRLTLRGIDASGARVEIGPIDFEAGIDASTAGFYGARTSPDPGEISQINGGFFGPQGTEFGYVFNSSRYEQGAGRFDLYFLGTVVGRR